MHPRITAWLDTPNPNALKAELSAAVPVTIRSFRSAEAAGAEPLAAAIFAVPGVTGLLFGDRWLTVNKSPDAAWKDVKAAVQRALESHAANA
ncbi:MAG: NifU N-terminal domain-containing protein [Phycisphaeraceae bacterium]|nr:NifU N-terminal domain-containing protein [Phycisphaeraceae bacterium]